MVKDDPRHRGRFPRLWRRKRKSAFRPLTSRHPSLAKRAQSLGRNAKFLQRPEGHVGPAAARRETAPVGGVRTAPRSRSVARARASAWRQSLIVAAAASRLCAATRRPSRHKEQPQTPGGGDGRLCARERTPLVHLPERQPSECLAKRRATARGEGGAKLKRSPFHAGHCSKREWYRRHSFSLGVSKGGHLLLLEGD